MLKLLCGNVIDMLRTLPGESVHCVVTSPPYWGLRDYKTELVVWGAGDCEHDWVTETVVRENRYGLGLRDSPASTRGGAVEIAEVGWQQIERGLCSKCGAWRGSLGAEPLHDCLAWARGEDPCPVCYVCHIRTIWRELWRVLRKDGTCWLVIGDSQSSGSRTSYDHDPKLPERQGGGRPPTNGMGLKPKDMAGVPWRVALALQHDGWYLRRDIVWCLSGGTWVYARTQKGDMPITLKDLSRLKPSTVQLWDGTAWNRLCGISRAARKGSELEILLRSGERVSCTPDHRFPTSRGLLKACELVIGDVLQLVSLPEPESIRAPQHLTEDAAWFAGLYIAEGSWSGNCVQISGHVKEVTCWERICRVAAAYGGSAMCSVSGNSRDVRVYGKILSAILDELVTGKTAKDKGFAPVVWRYGNGFIAAMLDGYLEGDGYHDEENRRWRLAFARNYNLERDLRTACARLGYRLILKLSRVRYGESYRPTFRGEIRKFRSGNFNERLAAEIVEIRKARCRDVYDLGVCGGEHLFALASGILVHNSKPNPMPESVTDRCTRSHEFVLHFSRKRRYYYDREAVLEPSVTQDQRRPYTSVGAWDLDGRPESMRYGGKPRDQLPVCYKGSAFDRGKTAEHQLERAQKGGRRALVIADDRKDLPTDIHSRHRSPIPGGQSLQAEPTMGRNLRDVWTIATVPFKGAHFAVFPPKLVEPCIKAGTSERGCCPHCGAPWTRITECETRNLSNAAKAGTEIEGKGHPTDQVREGHDIRNGPTPLVRSLGWRQSCQCTTHDPIPCTVLDPFMGSGTVGAVALPLGRSFVGIDLNPDYIALARRRIADAIVKEKRVCNPKKP